MAGLRGPNRDDRPERCTTGNTCSTRRVPWGCTTGNTCPTRRFSGLEPGYSAYGSMKGGLLMLTRYMAKEFSPRGIRVNSVAPGSTRTRIAQDAFTQHPEVIPPIAPKPRWTVSGSPTTSAW